MKLIVNAHRKGSVVEPVVASTLEEVRVPVRVLQSCVQAVRYALPVGDGLGVSALHWRLLSGVEPPEL